MGVLYGLDPRPAEVRSCAPDEGLQHGPVAVSPQELALLPQPPDVVLHGVTRPLPRLIGQLMSREPPHPGAHREPKLGVIPFLVRWRGGRLHQSWGGGVFFGCDFHVAAGHRGDAPDVGAVDEVTQEGGAEVPAGVETGQDKVRTGFLRRLVRIF